MLQCSNPRRLAPECRLMNLCARLFAPLLWCLAQAAVKCTQAETTFTGRRNSLQKRALWSPPSRLRLDTNPFPQSGTQPWLSDMPVLPSSHSPKSAHWSNSVALCAVMKDENTTDIVEWLVYYQWLGVDHVFLTDNNSANGERQRVELMRAFPRSFLTMRTELEPQGQLKVYAYCAEELRASYNWIAFLDLDEFVIIRDRRANSSLKTFLNEFKLFPGLSIHWVVVGPSGRRKRPELGGVLASYERCIPSAHPTVKTIANTYYLKGIAVHPHNFEFRGRMTSVTEDGREMGTQWHATPGFLEAGGSTYKCNRDPNQNDCFKTPALRQGSHPTVERVALFHYVTKSLEDYKFKLDRGTGLPGFNRSMDFYFDIASDEEDAPLCHEPGELAKECCSNLQKVLTYASAPHAQASIAAAADESIFASLGAHGDIVASAQRIGKSVQLPATKRLNASYNA